MKVFPILFFFLCIGLAGSYPPLGEESYLGARAGLKYALYRGDVSQCGYFRNEGQLYWEAGLYQASAVSWEKASLFCADHSPYLFGVLHSLYLAKNYTGAHAFLKERIEKLNLLDPETLDTYQTGIYSGVATTEYAPYLPEKTKLATTDRYNPGVASTLSIIPGLGHLYLKQPLRALHYLVVNAALASLTAWRFKESLGAQTTSGRVTAGLDVAILGLFIFPRYYFGAIKEAYRLAKEENRKPLQKNIQAFQRSFRENPLHTP